MGPPAGLKGDAFGTGGDFGPAVAKKSSASLSVTFLLKSFVGAALVVGDELENSNFEPCSCNSEN